MKRTCGNCANASWSSARETGDCMKATDIILEASRTVGPCIELAYGFIRKNSPGDCCAHWKRKVKR